MEGDCRKVHYCSTTIQVQHTATKNHTKQLVKVLIKEVNSCSRAKNTTPYLPVSKHNIYNIKAVYCIFVLQLLQTTCNDS